MYNAQITKNRIKELCKNKKIIMEDMLNECSLGINAVRQINDTKGMASYSLAKIADYLDCSVDYLLGRTDFPEINKGNIEKVDFSKLPAETIYKLIAFGGKENSESQPPIEPKTTL